MLSILCLVCAQEKHNWHSLLIKGSSETTVMNCVTGERRDATDLEAQTKSTYLASASETSLAVALSPNGRYLVVPEEDDQNGWGQGGFNILDLGRDERLFLSGTQMWNPVFKGGREKTNLARSFFVGWYKDSTAFAYVIYEHLSSGPVQLLANLTVKGEPLPSSLIPNRFGAKCLSYDRLQDVDYGYLTASPVWNSSRVNSAGPFAQTYVIEQPNDHFASLLNHTNGSLLTYKNQPLVPLLGTVSYSPDGHFVAFRRHTTLDNDSFVVNLVTISVQRIGPVEVFWMPAFLD